MQLRLDKYLADSGLGTRTGVRKLIRDRVVMVDGETARTGDQKVDPELNVVTVRGQRVGYTEYAYYLLNKPSGILTASRDSREKTVIDLIPEPKRRDLFPVGRLDRDTVGLLLITNDGQLSHRLLSPGKHVSKCYRVLSVGELPEDAEERVKEGLDIGDDEPSAPGVLKRKPDPDRERTTQILERYGLMSVLEENEGEPLHESELILTEGRFHQVKRMFEAMGSRVVFLERESMGGLTLPEDLLPGESRVLAPEAVNGVFS